MSTDADDHTPSLALGVWRRDPDAYPALILWSPADNETKP